MTLRDVFARSFWARINGVRRLAIIFALMLQFLVGALLIAISIPKRGAMQNPPGEACSKFLLPAVAKAMLAYRHEHGNLPAVVSGPRGYLHSWRVLLTPTLGADDDLSTCQLDYRFEEKWDSLHNRSAAVLAHRFTCPLESYTSGYPFISYLMLVRPVVQDPRTGRAVQPPLPDDAVVIVESANCGIEYGEPRDLQWDALWLGDSPFGPGKLHSLHAGVVKAVRMDGKVIDIPRNLSKEELRKLLSGTDGT